MTLVVAVATADGAWVGGERIAGTFEWTEISASKVIESQGDGYHFAIGFAGAPRVAQTILAVHPPDGRDHSLEWWLTEYCDRIQERCRDQGLMKDPGGCEPIRLADNSGFVLATQGRVFLVDRELAWEEPARGYTANGGAYAEFGGAYEVLSDQIDDPIEAARQAWPYVQRRCSIGDLVDEVFIPLARVDS